MKILITGANRGIGATLVKLAVEQGHSIVALARNADTLKEQYKN